MKPFDRQEPLGQELSLLFEPALRFGFEARVFETRKRHAHRRSVDRPRFAVRGELCNSFLVREQITKTKSGHGIVLRERAQHDEIRVVPDKHLSRLRLDKIDKRFINDNKRFPCQRHTSNFFQCRHRNQFAGDAVRRCQKHDIANLIEHGDESLRREPEAVIGGKRQRADRRAAE